MAVPGTMGKILLVDFHTRTISTETPEDDLYLTYLGGYGLGTYYLYRLQRPRVDPLGPEAAEDSLRRRNASSLGRAGQNHRP